ncbi:unnamed protein product [Cylindrotheca closterium]|uniref:Uncharacterized protein n=1 Tax=Cylindrotheca closterium TaxID=2856 RepID=A0AAD2CPZ6_9STRA|nr:unnamed protein product [Cylindrotheca closterium]
MREDSRKNDFYMSWSSDGADSSTSTTLPHVMKGSSSDDVVGDIVTPVSPSEAPSSPAAQVDFYTYSGDDEEGAVGELVDTKSEAKSHRWKGLIVILLLLALGFGLYILFRNEAPGTKDASNPPWNPADMPSGAPTSESETVMPSLTPTTPPLYDPPSVEDCIAIARGKVIDGQDEMLVERYEVVLDVALDSGGIAIQGILNRLVAETRQIILPEILGCGDASRKLMEIESGADDNPSASSAIVSMIRGSARRQLSLPTSPSSRFIMANAAVSIRNPSAEWCASGSGPLCYRVIMSFDMAFRSDDLKVLTVVQYIAEAFKSPDSLADKLLLGSPFQNIFVRDVYPAFHTAIPTLSPSHL